MDARLIWVNVTYELIIFVEVSKKKRHTKVGVDVYFNDDIAKKETTSKFREFMSPAKIFFRKYGII